MGVFQRKASTSSNPGASSSSASSSPSFLRSKTFPGCTKAPKPTKPSLVQRVSSSVRPTPKPQPSLLRRATTGLTEFSTSSWEKRMLKRLRKFPQNHPLITKVVGTALFVAGTGAGAAAMPALMAALGLKLAVVNGTLTLAYYLRPAFGC